MVLPSPTFDIWSREIPNVIVNTGSNNFDDNDADDANVQSRVESALSLPFIKLTPSLSEITAACRLGYLQI